MKLAATRCAGTDGVRGGDVEVLRFGDLVGGDQDGAQRAEGVEALAADPLPAAAFFLPPASGDVVADGVAQDVFEGFVQRDVAAGLAVDHGQFALEIDLRSGRAVRQADRAVRVVQGAGGFHKNDGALGRGIVAAFLGVFEVVLADAEEVNRLDGGLALADPGGLAGRPGGFPQGRGVYNLGGTVTQVFAI